MFGWDFNYRGDRIKLFCLIFVLFLVIGFGILYSTQLFHHPENSQGHTVSRSDAGQELESQPLASASTNPSEAPKENLSEQSKEKAKKPAVAFVKAFYTYDSDRPLQYLTNSKSYMADSLYHRLKAYPRRQTLDRAKTKVLSTDVTPVADQGEDSVRWNVIVYGQALSEKGNKQAEENWYLVTLKPIDGSWKVTEVEVDVPN